MQGNLHTALDAAREYALDAAGRGVQALSAEAIAHQVNADLPTALQILDALTREGYFEPSASVVCPHCGTVQPLASQTLKALADELQALEGEECRECGQPFPRPSRLKVDYRFFYSAAGRRAAAANSSKPHTLVAGSGGTDSFVLASGDIIKAANRAIIVVQPGGVLQMGDSSQVMTGGTMSGGAFGNLQNSTSAGVVASSFALPSAPAPAIAQAASSSPFEGLTLRGAPSPPQWWHTVIAALGTGAVVVGLYAVPWVYARVFVVAAVVGAAAFTIFHPSRWHRGIAIGLFSAVMGRRMLPFDQAEINVEHEWVRMLMRAAVDTSVAAAVTDIVVVLVALGVLILGELIQRNQATSRGG